MSWRTLWGRLAACCGVALLAVVATGMGGGLEWEPEEAPPPVAVPTVLSAGWAQFLKLDSTAATVAFGPGSPAQEIRVALRRTMYGGKYLRLQAGEAAMSPWVTLLCYELLRTDGDQPGSHREYYSYSWAMWQPLTPWWTGQKFWLFKLSGGSYLVFGWAAFPNALSLSLANVTYPRDRLVAFSEDLARESPSMADAPPWSGQRRHWSAAVAPAGGVLTWRQPKEWLPEAARTLQPGEPAPRLQATSLTVDEDGNPVLKFALTGTDVRATLAVRGGKLVCIELTFAPGQAGPAKAQDGASVEAPSEAVVAGGTSAYQPRTSEEIRKDLRRARLSNVDAADPQAIFQQCLPGLRDHANEENVRWFGTMDTLRDCEAYRRIIAVGPRMVPLIVEQLEIEDDPTLRCMLGAALTDTSGFVRVPSNPWLKEPVAEWWAGGQALTNERFEQLYAEGKSATIRCLGLATLPKLMEKLAEGDLRIVRTMHSLTSQKADLTGKTPAERAASCLAWWEANKAYWLIPFPDTVKRQKEEAEAKAQATAKKAEEESKAQPAAQEETGQTDEQPQADEQAAPPEGEQPAGE